MDEEQILLEDDDIYVIIPHESMAEGHMIIAPKEHYVILEEVPDDLLGKIFQVANKLSGILFEIMECDGTNFLIQNGEPAGQTVDVFSLNVIPRHEDDDLNLRWEGKDFGEKQLENVLDQFKRTEEKQKEQEYINKQKEKVEEDDDSEEVEESTLVKHLDRVP